MYLNYLPYLWPTWLKWRRCLTLQKLWVSIAKDSRGYNKFPHVYSVLTKTPPNPCQWLDGSFLALLTLFCPSNHSYQCFFTNSRINMKIWTQILKKKIDTWTTLTKKLDYRPKESTPINVWFVGWVYKMHRNFGNYWVEYRDPIDLMDCPSNKDIGLSWLQKTQEQVDLWSY